MASQILNRSELMNDHPTEHFALVEAILKLQPTEYTAVFQHGDYFSQYGYRSTGSVKFKWHWFKNALLAEDNVELERIYKFCKP
jgi:hypothetical protein